MLLRKFEMPWRTTYEAYSAAAWLACLAGMTWLWLTAPMPGLPFLYLGALAAVFFLWNAIKTWEIWRLKFNLGGKGISFISDAALQEKIEERLGLLWVGTGFDWTPLHTQRVYEIKRAD